MTPLIIDYFSLDFKGHLCETIYMNRFEEYARAPLTEQEHIEREEDVERFAEARLQRLEDQYRYQSENWIELAEFTGKRPARMERMQMDLFEEVA